MKRFFLVSALWCALGSTGCITIPGNQLGPLTTEPVAPEILPNLQQTVGNFSFHLDGGKMITSNKAGRMVNDELLKVWKRKGYIKGSEYVKSSQFTGQADFNLTLSGSLYGRSSIFMQILSGLTLFVIPHTIEQRFDIQYTLENVRTKEKFGASVEDSYTQWSQLFLIFGAPWSQRGARSTYEVMADHLYEQLRRDGAFEIPTARALPH